RSPGPSPPSALPPSSVCERKVVVDGTDGGGALAHRRGDALRRPRPHIAHREEARMTRLVRQRRAVEGRPRTVEMLRAERAIGEHEALVVERGATGEPFRRGVGADE